MANSNQSVIARRCEHVGFAFTFAFTGIFIVLFSVALLLASLADKPLSDKVAPIIVFTIFLALFLATLVYATVKFIRYSKIPRVIMTAQDGKLYFADRVCNTDEISSVSYHRYTGRYFLKLNYGDVIITVGGRVYKLRYVDDLDKVEKKLKALFDTVKDREET